MAHNKDDTIPLGWFDVILTSAAVLPLLAMGIYRYFSPAPVVPSKPRVAIVASAHAGEDKAPESGLDKLVEARKAAISAGIKSYLSSAIDEIKIDLSHYSTKPRSANDERRAEAEAVLLKALVELQSGRNLNNYVTNALLSKQDPEKTIRLNVESLKTDAQNMAGLDEQNYAAIRKNFTSEVAMLLQANQRQLR